MIRVVCLFALFAASACSGFSDARDPALADVPGAVRLIAPSDREAPINLSGEDLDGKPLSLPKSSRRATVVNIWWSGCAECRKEAPTLRRLSAGSDRIADFVGIDVRESGRDQAKRFEERFEIPYPSFYDPGGQLLLELRDSVPYSAIPTTLVLDRSMRIGAVILGEIPGGNTLADVVDQVLAN